MATISTQFQQSGKAHIGSIKPRLDAHAPSRTVADDPQSLASWLLPPEPVTGIEALVQATSKMAGILLLMASVAAIAWILIG
jgi:hypothetical protein